MRYLIGLEIEEVTVGIQTEKMPLHCTLVPWFVSHTSPTHIGEMVSRAAEHIDTFPLRTDKRALFGTKNDIPVWTLQPHALHTMFHNILMQKLLDHSVEFENIAYCDLGYRPHVSDVDGRSLNPSVEQYANRLYVLYGDSPESPRHLLYAGRLMRKKR
jgi:2'-5' RNA ligase